MKKIIATLVIAFTGVSLCHAEPSVGIDEALKLAKKYLKEHGRSGVFIRSLSLDPTSLAKSQYVWSAMWNAPVMLDDTKRETGIEIAMDGSVARFVEKVGSSKSSPGSVGVPADRAELSNHRTRSTRPSILDLKH
jgi:hypothetical protein